MRRVCAWVALVALLGMGVGSSGTPARAEVGFVTVAFRKGAAVLGVGRGEGILEYRRQDHPFTVTGLSVGAAVGVSATKFTGRAYNVRGLKSFEGTYTAVGGGAALAGGAGAVYLQNRKGVVLRLDGPKIGVELSVALAGVRIHMK